MLSSDIPPLWYKKFKAALPCAAFFKQGRLCYNRPMQFSEYEKMIVETAVYPDKGKNFVYPTLGLVGEAGEVAEKIKKVLREESGVVTDEKKEEIKKELGDVLWYLAALSRELGFTIEDVAQKNIEKLASRKERGVLHGSGDNR